MVPRFITMTGTAIGKPCHEAIPLGKGRYNTARGKKTSIATFLQPWGKGEAPKEPRGGNVEYNDIHIRGGKDKER